MITSLDWDEAESMLRLESLGKVAPLRVAWYVSTRAQQYDCLSVSSAQESKSAYLVGSATERRMQSRLIYV